MSRLNSALQYKGLCEENRSKSIYKSEGEGSPEKGEENFELKLLVI